MASRSASDVGFGFNPSRNAPAANTSCWSDSIPILPLYASSQSAVQPVMSFLTLSGSQAIPVVHQ